VNDDDDGGGGGGDTTVIVLSQVTKEEMVNESWLVMVGDGGDTILCWMADGVQEGSYSFPENEIVFWLDRKRNRFLAC
jgi:hypothetical protein